MRSTTSESTPENKPQSQHLHPSHPIPLYTHHPSHIFFLIVPVIPSVPLFISFSTFFTYLGAESLFFYMNFAKIVYKAGYYLFNSTLFFLANSSRLI